MFEFLDPDPGQAALKLALLAGMAVLAVVLWRELVHRSRRHGGGLVAAAVMASAVVALVLGLAPGVLPVELQFLLLVAGVAAILRPEQVVKAAGGPSPAYRALREGRELQLLVRERGGWSVAGRNGEVRERLERLSEVSGPGTERYVTLLRRTLLADPSDPAVADGLGALGAEETRLRASLGARPMFERDLDRRLAALDGERGSGS
jgi:hypothetical protein